MTARKNYKVLYTNAKEEIDYLKRSLMARDDEIARLEGLKPFDPRKLSINLDTRYDYGYGGDSTKSLELKLSYDGEVVDTTSVYMND